MKRSAKTSSYNDLRKLIDRKLEEEQKSFRSENRKNSFPGGRCIPIHNASTLILHEMKRRSVATRNFNEEEKSGALDTESHSETITDPDDETNYSNISASDFPRSLLAALSDESFARRSSFMSQGRLTVGSNLDGLVLEREKTKIESFDCYILVSVLTATASFSTLQDFTPLDSASTNVFCSILLVATQMAAGVSTICGLYATVVFSLTVLYAKSAIGLHKDQIYTYFLKETGMVRVRGFKAFSVSLLAFALEAGLVTFLRLPGLARFPVAIVIAILIRNLCNDWLRIVDVAKVIYTGEIPCAKEKLS